jgi:Chaperone of endosialidase
VADGFEALTSNTTGGDNTASGYLALQENTTGYQNTATGAIALNSNTTGYYNTATGVYALQINTTGNYNVATGNAALHVNTTGTQNTATGAGALEFNTTGNYNTAAGVNALLSNTTGNYNIALGILAGTNLTTGNNNIDIGASGVAAESNTIRIGTAGTQTQTFIAGIRGVTTVNANAAPVVIDSAGQLGTVSSSERFKKEIKPMDKASEPILALKPVTFHYKSDATGTPQFGLIAEEVAKVNPDLVVRDADGEIYTVRYDAVNAMLLNEFLKEHRTVQEQQQEISALRAELNEQRAELKEQRTLIQKVSDKVEINKPAPQVALNNQ